MRLKAFAGMQCVTLTHVPLAGVGEGDDTAKAPSPDRSMLFIGTRVPGSSHAAHQPACLSLTEPVFWWCCGGRCAEVSLDSRAVQAGSDAAHAG